MARYRKIDVRMWGDERFRRLSPAKPNGQTLWVFLLTGPHTTILPGLFRAGEAAIAEELGWDLKGFREAFAEVSREGLAVADWKARVVWLPNVIRYGKPESPNVVRSWRAAWDEIPECSLKDEACQSLKGFVEGLGEGFAQAFAEASPKPCRKTCPNSESESESESEQERPSVSGAQKKPPVVPKERENRPSSVEEVRSEIARLGYHFGAEEFFAYYEARGWKLKGRPIEKWRACLVTFEKNEIKSAGNGNGTRPTGAPALNPTDNEARRRKALGLPLFESKGAP